jgi:hypothetical protein
MAIILTWPRVAIQTVNQPPTDITLSNQTIVDNAVSGVAVGQLGASDPDNSTWTWATNNNQFTVDPASGAAPLLIRTTVGTLDVGVAETVIVSIIDAAGNHYNETFEVSVLDHAAAASLATFSLVKTDGTQIAPGFIPDSIGFGFKTGDVPAGTWPQFLTSAGTNIPYTVLHLRCSHVVGRFGPRWHQCNHVRRLRARH